MKIERATFRKLLDFVAVPPLFRGQQCRPAHCGRQHPEPRPLPGRPLHVRHGQGPHREEHVIPGFEDVEAGIVNWPMSCIRLTCADDERLVELADKILTAWRGYTDEASLRLCRDGRRTTQHHHPHCPDAGWQISSWIWFCATTSPPGAPAGGLPSPRKAPPHQKGEHRPDRGHGSGSPSGQIFLQMKK